MISKEIEAETVRLFHAEKWPLNTIAIELGRHHSTILRVIERHGLPRPKLDRPSKLTSSGRSSTRRSRSTRSCVRAGSIRCASSVATPVAKATLAA